MLSLTRYIVNDRNSNRLDIVMSILGSELAYLVGSCLHQLRCLMHQQCFDRFALKRGSSPCGWGLGFKRDAYEPAAISSATPTRRNPLVNSTTGHRAVNYAG